MADGTGTVNEAAAAAGLGAAGPAFTGVRVLPAGVLWGVAGGAALAGAVLAVAGVTVLALLIVPAVLLGLALVRFRLPPRGVRRLLLVYDNGLADLTTPPAGPQQLRIVRWTDVSGVTAAALSVHGQPDLPLTGLSRAAALRGELRKHLPVPASVLEDASTRAVLIVAGLTGLALLPALALAATPERSREPRETPAMSTPAPGLAAPPTSRATRMPSWSRSPADTGPKALPMPTIVEGFYSVCRGNTVPTAPPYAGPPPHYAYAPAPTIVDSDFYAPASTKVQVVVCITTTNDEKVVRTCRYVDGDGKPILQSMVRTTWNISIVEARTGRVVFNGSFVGGDTACGLIPDFDYSRMPIGYSKYQRSRATSQQEYEHATKHLNAKL